MPPAPQQCLCLYSCGGVRSFHHKESKFIDLPRSILLGPQVSRLDPHFPAEHLMLRAAFWPGGLHCLLGVTPTQLLAAETAHARVAGGAASNYPSVTRITANFQSHHFADMATYTTPDVSWVNIVGRWWRGRPQVQQAHQQIFDTIFKSVNFTPGKTTARGIAPGVAVVNLYCHVGAFYPPDGIDHGTNKAKPTTC